MKEKCVQLPWELFRDMLEERRQDVNNWWGWEIPDCIWEDVMVLLEAMGGCPDPWNNRPSYIVDNLALNGSWATFEQLRKEYDWGLEKASDDEIIEYLEEEGHYVTIFPDEQMVLLHLGF